MSERGANLIIIAITLRGLPLLAHKLTGRATGRSPVEAKALVGLEECDDVFALGVGAVAELQLPLLGVGVQAERQSLLVAV